MTIKYGEILEKYQINLKKDAVSLRTVLTEFFKGRMSKPDFNVNTVWIAHIFKLSDTDINSGVILWQKKLKFDK